MSTGDLKVKAQYYAFGRNDGVGGVPFVDPGDFSNAYIAYIELSGHVPNLQSAFNAFRAGKRIGE